jgi:hypothetical protein
MPHTHEKEVSTMHSYRSSNSTAKTRTERLYNIIATYPKEYKDDNKIIEVEKRHLSFKNHIFSAVQQVPIVVW